MKPLTIVQKGNLSVFEAFSQNDQTVVETFGSESLFLIPKELLVNVLKRFYRSGYCSRETMDSGKSSCRMNLSLFIGSKIQGKS